MPARAAITTTLVAISLVGCADRDRPPADAATSDASTVDAAGADASPEDAGAPDAAVPMCTENIQNPYMGATPCGTTTRDCAMTCKDSRCAEDCFAADPSPSCLQCWTQNQLSCWNRNGCQAQWNCISECITTHCPSVDPGCIGEQCLEEDEAYADCFEPLRMMCLERTVDCLPD